jgi:hypothetical protein
MRTAIQIWLRGILLLIALGPIAVLAQSIESVMMPGELIADHAKYESDCKKCHVPFDKKALSKQCLDCHKKIADDIRNHTRFHGRLKSTTCESCHTEHKGRKAKITVLDPLKFDHNLTEYPLKGGHERARTKCEGCHKPTVKYRDTPQLCNACHKKDDVHKGKLGVKCEQCHDVNDWKKTSFDHNKTKFKLEFGHRDVKCKDCHTDKLYVGTPKECVACHKKDDDKKGHKGHYGKKCEACHTVKEWKEIIFDHDRDTKYVLEGKHIKVECKACHKSALNTVELATTCISCHRKDDEGEKGHKGRYGEKCQTCHTAKEWKDIRFNHDRETKYPLRGKHEKVKCSGCHTGPLYKTKTPIECVACHRKDDNDKGHKGSLGDKCEKCHTESSWKEAKFDHDKETDYPLTGKHRDAKCNTCHKSGVTSTAGKPREKAPRNCNGCHEVDDQKKGHKGRFGEKCETCHTTKEWKDITFNHDRDTKYLLRGKHIKTKCADCHTGILYKEKTAIECIACHRKDDNDKGHKGTLGTRCEACHNEAGWKVETFDHNKSRFPLTGAHIKTECKSCHKTVNFKDAPMQCYACHEKEDTHKRRLGTDCESCHNSRTWKSWDFDHDAKTSFRLGGAHLKVECATCHKEPMKKLNGRKIVARTCVSCHTNDDVHKGAFGTRCERCHTDVSWLTTLRQ